MSADRRSCPEAYGDIAVAGTRGAIVAGMGALLGVEGNGSYCHAVLVDPAGTFLGVGANDDPANWDDVGIAAAAAAIRSCVIEALEAAELSAADVEASVFALAGVDFPYGRAAAERDPVGDRGRRAFLIVNDSFAALRAGTDGQCGVVVIAGNGSVVAGRNEQGATFRSLGMGPMFGDSGSATDLSEAGVTAVAEAYLERGPVTSLTELLCAQSGVRSVVELLEGVARARIDPVPFAPTIIRAAEDGDAVAQGRCSPTPVARWAQPPRTSCASCTWKASRSTWCSPAACSVPRARC